MKKSFVCFSLSFLFLAMFDISASSANVHGRLEENVFQSLTRNNVFQNTLAKIDSAANATQQAELETNTACVITRIAREIPDNLDILMLSALRMMFRARICTLIDESLEENILSILRTMASLDAVTQKILDIQ
jgi:hypothetical protein